MTIGETITAYKDDGTEYEMLWTKEMDERHNERYYSPRWVKMTDEIREHLQSHIDQLNKFERPQRHKDEIYHLNVMIEEAQDKIKSQKVMFWEIEHILLENDIEPELIQ